MSEKHTPGPWEYDPDSDFHNDPAGIAYVDVSAGDTPDAPSRFVRVDKGWTTKADARLIAAAPDLLAALREGDEIQKRTYGHADGLHLALYEWAAKARAAIAKATESQS